MGKRKNRPTFPGRVCPHTAEQEGKVSCEACAFPFGYRRMTSRKFIRNPKRLHEVNRAKHDNPKPFPRKLERKAPR